MDHTDFVFEWPRPRCPWDTRLPGFDGVLFCTARWEQVLGRLMESCVAPLMTADETSRWPQSYPGRPDDTINGWRCCPLVKYRAFKDKIVFVLLFSSFIRNWWMYPIETVWVCAEPGWLSGLQCCACCVWHRLLWVRALNLHQCLCTI